MVEIFHPCNSLAYNWQAKTADWMDNGKAPAAETTLVNDGDMLPDGTVATTVEGGKCLMAQTGFVNAERQCCNFYMTYLNPLGNWDFRDLELLKIPLFTNHPEHPIRLLLSCQPWTTYTVAEIPAGTLPLRQWVTVEVDLRTSPQGSPDLTAGKAFTVYASGIDGDRYEYYVLVDYVTLEKATVPIPLGCRLQPLSANILEGDLATFQVNAWGGTSPYTVEWIYDGAIVKTEQIIEYQASNCTLVGQVAGEHHLYARVTDSSVAQVTSDVATIMVRELLPPPEPIDGRAYVVGSQLYDWRGRKLHLHGVHLHGFEDTPNGHWIDKDGASHYGQNVTWAQIESEYMPQMLDGIRSWGANSIRVHCSVELFLNNIGEMREHFKLLLSECRKRGLYVVLDFYGIRYYGQLGARPTPIPWPPYLNSDELTATGWTSSQDFVDFWAMIANELGVFPNVMFEVWNEPHTPNGYDSAVVQPEFFNVTQQVINAVRAVGATHPIVVQWGYGSTWVYDYPSETSTMYWVFDYPLSDPERNIIYSTHGYRDYGSLTGYYGTYATRRSCYTREEIEQTWINCHIFEVAKLYPLFLGEIGFDPDSPVPAPDGTDPMVAETEAWKNMLNLANENGIHYNAFWFWTGGVRRLVQANLPNYQPNLQGKILLEKMYDQPPTPIPPLAIVAGTAIAVAVILWWLLK